MSTRSTALLSALFLVVAPGCSEWPGLSSNSDAGAVGGGGTRVDDTSGLLGSSCAGGRAVCNAGLTCLESLPGGLCTRICQSDADCGGGVCVPTGQGLFCYKSCISDQTCRPGYDCTSDGQTSACMPGLSSGALDAGAD